MTFQFSIRRFNPETDREPYWKDYGVAVDPEDRVLDALVAIKRYQDGTLTLRSSCAHGVCGSDGMVINGRSRLACKVLLRDAARENDPITVEPLPAFPVVKDLVVDQSLFFAHYREVDPFLIADAPAGEKERLQSQEEWNRFEYTSRCILCGLCTGSCPTYWADKEFLGPAAIVQAHRFIFDSRDTATARRINRLGLPGGVFSCHSIFNCSEACPREIEVVRAINEVRQATLRRPGKSAKKK